MANSLTKPKHKFSVEIQGDTYKNLINNTLGDPKKAQDFIAAVSSAVAVNPGLQDCEAGSILSAALLGQSLGLSPSPQLGQYYMVPFKDKKKGVKVAQFQLGYKGYIQLAIRSGQYKKLNVMSIKEGELIRFDPLDEDIQVNLIEDEEEREKAKTIGYYAMFEYLNGFRKALYWSYEKMRLHADRYSFAYSIKKHDQLLKQGISKEEKDEYSSFWYKDFDGMAYKTMLRQLISKWGIMSIEFQNVMEKDMAVISETGKINYVDNPLPEEPEEEKSDSLPNQEGINEEDDFFNGVEPPPGR